MVGTNLLKREVMLDKKELERILGYEIHEFGFMGADREILNALGDVKVSINIHVRPKTPIKFINITIGGEDGN